MIASMEWYRVFLHAAETSNLTKAAHILHMTQPSVSYAIKQLEESLGIKLFDRLSKGVLLTQEGQALYKHVRQAFDELESAERRMNNIKHFSEGRLRIGANGAIVRDLLLPSLDAFRARYPDIRIQLSQEQTTLILERLKQGSLGIGLVHLPILDEEIEISDTYVASYCAVVGKAFADMAQQSLSTEQLTKLPLLMLSPGSSTRSYIEEWFRSQGVEAEADFELNSLDMLSEFAERGYGIAFLPRSFIASRIASGFLLELHTDVPIPDRHIAIALRKHSSPSVASTVFLRMLRTPSQSSSCGIR